jgi:phage shock protein C
MGNVHDSMQRRGLVRPTHGRLLAGVCAGLAHRFGIDPWAARLLFIALLLIPGSQLILYPVLWIVMPSEGRAHPRFETSGPGAPTRP